MPITEVSIFGGNTSYGESIVIHDGNNNWFIIDSFVDKNGKSVPIQYLESIGVDIGNSVKGVVATHWDNDHINGLLEVVSRCTSAKFFCSAAYNSEEFMNLIECDKAIHNLGRSLEIFSSVLDHLASLGRIPDEASANQSLWADLNFGTELISLSPSSKTKHDSRLELKKVLSHLSSSNSRIPRQIPNDYSVVLYFKIKDLKIVLGGDLQLTSDQEKGWHAVHSSHLCPKSIEILKVSHHGSHNGFLQEFWEKNLSPDVYTCTTPFAKSGIPTDEDISRTLSYSTKSYITASPSLLKRQKFEKTADKLLERMGKKIMDLTINSPGQIKLTYDHSKRHPKWEVSLVEPASELAKYIL